MSTICQPLLDDPADLFTQLYDALDDDLFRTEEAQGWLTSERVQEIAAIVEEQLIAQGTLNGEEVEESIEFAADSEERIFAHLLGLDRAFSYVNPLTATYDPAALLPLSSRYVLTGQFNTENTTGALLPRVAFPGREILDVETRADAFVSVVRVPQDVWERTDHSKIRNDADFGRRDRERGIAVACIPFLADPNELTWQVERRGGRPRFRIAPKRGDQTRDRVGRLVRALDDLGANVVVVPELCLSAELLETWQQVLAESLPLPGSVLRWIFVGTGSVALEEPPRNRGVLLDRSGDILLSQDKLYAFTITTEQLRDWRLTELLGEETAVESLARGDRITVAESGIGRLVILICEDLSRVSDLSNPLVAHGVSLALAPVFSKPTLEHHWEHSHAKVYAQAAGTQVVISNSLVVARLMGEEHAGTSLAHSPDGHEVGRSENEETISMFRLSAWRHPQVMGGLRIEPADVDPEEPERSSREFGTRFVDP